MFYDQMTNNSSFSSTIGFLKFDNEKLTNTTLEPVTHLLDGSG